MNPQTVPYFRPQISEAEIAEVVSTLRSGWITSGPQVRRFETEFAAAIQGRNAIALNSCTAALHLAVEALGLGPGMAVLVPAMTFAATAEIIRYQGAVPILVDCDPETLHLDLADAVQKISDLHHGELGAAIPPDLHVAGIVPVHVGGQMMNMELVQRFAERHSLWVVEDAAHSFPAAWRHNANSPWQWCGQSGTESTAAVTCFSFYANKTITTGEGGMAVTSDNELAERIKLMALHGLSRDAWDRYSGKGTWDYRIVAPGYKYNLTDVAAALGLQQLARAEAMRQERETLAARYDEALSDIAELQLPTALPDRIHAWHLYPVRLRLERLALSRHEFMAELLKLGVNTSVHWRPLHLHPYYQATYGWHAEQLPVATRVWQQLISLPLFPGMRDDEFDHVVASLKTLCQQHARKTKHRTVHPQPTLHWAAAQ